MTIPWRTVVRRLLSMMGTLLGVAIFVFIMLRAIPGNQITAGLGTEAAALTPACTKAVSSCWRVGLPGWPRLTLRRKATKRISGLGLVTARCAA